MESSASIKIEGTVKIEAEEPAPIQPLQVPALKTELESTSKKDQQDSVDHSSSQTKTQTPASQPKEDLTKEMLELQNNFIYKACFDFIRSNMMPTLPKTMEMFPNFTNLNPWGNLLPDPFTFKAFVNFKKEYENFASHMNMPPYLPTAPPSNSARSNISSINRQPSNPSTKSQVPLTKTKITIPIVNPPKPATQEKEPEQPVIKAENIIEKKEANSQLPSLLSLPVAVAADHKSPQDDSANASSDDNKSPRIGKKIPKKKAQNRIKNIPGLVVQRVRSSIKNYLSLNPKLDKHERRLGYVDKVLVHVSKTDRERLLTFLENYQKNWKTWNTIQNFLKTDTKYGGILLDVVLQFFGPDGLDDFNDWLTSGKMGQKSKVAVTEMKEKIGVKFSKILLKAEAQESMHQNKMIKKEEDDV